MSVHSNVHGVSVLPRVIRQQLLSNWQSILIWTQSHKTLTVEPVIEKPEMNLDVTYFVSFGYLPSNVEFIKIVKTYDCINKTVILNITGLDSKSLKIKDGVHLESWEQLVLTAQ